MINTRIAVPRKAQAYAQFAATELAVNIPEVYGALILHALEGKTPDQIAPLLKPIIAKEFKAAVSVKPSAKS